MRCLMSRCVSRRLLATCSLVQPTSTVKQTHIPESPSSPLRVKSAYVHLPFCKRRCYYCDFPIQVLGSRQTATGTEAVSEYTRLVCREIQQTTKRGDARLDTLFFGGGTPSLTPPDELCFLIDSLKRKYGFEGDIEISMEADPGTFDAEKLKGFLDLGINRISLGVQSFDDDVLKLCGRSHEASDIWAAVSDVRSSGVRSWSLDLISGLPHVTVGSWRRTIETAISLEPDHVSIYDLQIEPSTAFDRWYNAEQAPLPSNGLSAEMYATASNLLCAAGYEHYEISNYAKEGHRCRHNMTYWQNQSFYGFGLGATSNTGTRFARPRQMKAYKQWVQQMSEFEEGHPEATLKYDEVAEVDNMLETIMLGLRLKDGIDLEKFSDAYGKEASANLTRSLHEFCSNGLVEIVDHSGRRLNWSGSWSHVHSVRLSDPNGFLLSNSVISSIFGAF